MTRRPLRGPIQFSTAARGERVLLDVQDNRLRCKEFWVTEIGGRRGNALRALPHSAGFKLAQVPVFQSASTMSWLEDLESDDGSDRTRFRVGRDLRSIPRTTTQRPRC